MIISHETGVSADIKLLVIDDVYQNGELSFQEKQKFYECFRSISRDLSLKSWLVYFKTISSLLEDMGDMASASEVNEICGKLVQDVPGIVQGGNVSTEEIIEQIAKAYIAGNSVYAPYLAHARDNVYSHLMEGIRVTVDFENGFYGKEHRNITDGYVYFGITNIGHIPVAFDDDCRVEVFHITESGERAIPLGEVEMGLRELRPGWITGCRQNIRDICSNCRSGSEIQIEIRIIIRDLLICCRKEIMVVGDEHLIRSLPKLPENGYYVDTAIDDSDEKRTGKLYGREKLKTDIETYLEHGELVIYGPSRIGKSSLLNWIRHSLANKWSKQNKRTVITILVGGEENRFDYISGFGHDSELQYHNKNEMTKFLLEQSMLAGLTSARRGSRTYIAGMEIALGSMIDLVRDELNKDQPLIDKYYVIDEILEKNHSEIWLLFDEFQKVVENWKSIEKDMPYGFIEICNIINSGSLKNIRLVFCGADELLKHMVIKTNSIWRKEIFDKRVRKVLVNPIDEPAEDEKVDAFVEMVTEDKAVVIPGLKYSDCALKTLSVYTNRIPLYCKEICNKVLFDISCQGVKAFGRDIIYSYDISVSTRELLLIQEKELRNEKLLAHEESKMQITDAVTKGLKEYQWYFWFLASWFKENPLEEEFDFERFVKEKGNFIKNKDENRL